LGGTFGTVSIVTLLGSLQHFIKFPLFKFFPSKYPQPILESMVAQAGSFAIVPLGLFAFLPVFNMFLEELTPCLTILFCHDSFLLGIVFKEPIMT
jgi:hypothetical protein